MAGGFVDRPGQALGLLLSLAFLVCLCTAQSPASADEESSSSWSSSADPTERLFPCKDNAGRISIHGETYLMTECSSCTCQNSTLSCQFLSCKAPTCRAPQKYEGICCRDCPYNITVTQVTPEPAPDTFIEEGVENTITLDLNAMYIDNRETTGVSGQFMWTGKLWMSSDADGSSELAGTVVDEALTQGQQSQDLKKSSSETFEIENIRYQMDLAGHTCREARFICAKFNKGPNPEVTKDYLAFHFSGSPDESVLTGCTKVKDCRGPANVLVQDVEPVLASSTVIKEGGMNDLTLDLSVNYADTEETTDVAGDGLWTARMWLSSDETGAGELAGTRVENVLSARQQGQDLTKDPSRELAFDGVQYSLNMGQHSCAQAQYLCARFDKGPSPQLVPKYTSFDFAGDPGESALTGCTAIEQCEGVKVSSLDWTPEYGNMQFGVPTPVTIDATVETDPDSRSLAGSGLWRMDLFGSKNMDGSGERRPMVSQILDQGGQARPLSSPGSPIQFDNINTRFPVEEVGCSKLPYLCMDFKKADRPNPDYTFATTSGEDSLVKCRKEKCRGVYVSDVDATLRRGGLTEGASDNEVVFDTVVQTTDESRPVVGTGLWKLNLYGNGQSDGLGAERYNEQEQVLTASDSGKPLQTPGSQLNFQPVTASYDMTGLDCAKVKYLCTEFDGGEDSSVSFEVQPVPADDRSVLRDCMEVPDDFCTGVEAERFDWSYDAGRPVPGEPTPVKFDAQLFTTSKSRDLQGDGLWRMGMYGSKSPDGDPTDRFGYVSQALSQAGAGTSLTGGQPMAIADQETKFDIGSIGCNEYGYVCAEFTQGDSPNPDYKFEIINPPREVMTSCKKQECSARAVFTDLESSFKDDSFVVEGRQSNPLPMDITGITSEESTTVDGTDLWRVGAFGSANPDGRGRKIAYQSQVLEQPHRDQPLEMGADLPFADATVDFDMTGLQCEDVKYLCTELRKDPVARPSYTFEAVPNEDALVSCHELGDRCQGVTATGVDWSYTPGTMQYGVQTPVTVDASVAMTPESRALEGSGLWKMSLFGSRSSDGTGQRMAERSQILDGFKQATPLPAGGPLPLTEVATSFPVEDLGCGEYQYLCVEFTKGDYADPRYKFQTTGGSDSIVDCKASDCGGVFVSGVDSNLVTAELYEGKPSNLVSFDTVVQTTDESIPVVGLNMWRLNMYGSERSNGQGPRLNPQEQVLNDYFSSRELITPGQTLDFRTVHSEYDMTGVNCKKLKYLCTEFSRNPSSSREFELTPVPDERVLRDCMEVPDEMCNGVIIEDMDWTMREVTGKITPGTPTPIRLDVDVESRSTAGSATGDALWRVGVFGATRPDGRGPRIGTRRQVLDRSQSGRDLTAGETLTFDGVDTEFDLTQIGCETEYQYLCVEYSKGLRAQPDFKFKTADGGDTITKCKEEECRKGVKIRELQVGGTELTTLKENTPNNRVIYDLNALTTPDSGGVYGDDLWELSLFGSNNARGVGRRMNEERQVFNNYQQGKDVEAGRDIRFGMVDTNFDMEGLSCKDVPYLCSELRKGKRPDPDFRVTPVPNDSVMKKCFRVKCDGVTIDSTSLRVDDLTISDQTDEIIFDVTVTANPTSGDATGRNLWNLETYVANDDSGRGRRRTLDRQTLTPEMASRDLRSGSQMTFNNLAARVQKEDVPCAEGGGYLCVEIQKSSYSSFDFTLDGARDDSLRRCRKLNCAKTEIIPGPKGQKGLPGEAAVERVWDLAPSGAPGSRGPPGIKGPRGYPGRGGPIGLKGPRGDNGQYGYSGIPGNPGPPGPPGESVTAPADTGPSSYKGKSWGFGFASAPQEAIQGPPGPQGLDGSIGDKGPPGLHGVAGDSGPQGRQGRQGPLGPRGSEGDDGKDGDDGNRGTFGPAGPIGTQGSNGLPGNPGRQGHKGWRGSRGRKGRRGDDGEVGDAGARGASGLVGRVGDRGERGPSGERGDRGPRGSAGRGGQKGKDGNIGDTGAMGPTGGVGARGRSGAKGEEGAQGDQGILGLPGQAGESGADGSPGATGTTGADGKTGATGEVGEMGGTGPVGPVGAAGARGSTGARGANGIAGEPGAQGYRGLAGSRGSDGPRGARGPVGITGERGSDGDEGSTGPDGPVGGPGARGPMGVRGGIGPVGSGGPVGPVGQRGDVGEHGPRGAPGGRGEEGKPGQTGEAGQPGAPGMTGSPGRDGNLGKPGPPGPNGNDGSRGSPGLSGIQGSQGQTGPAGAKGVNGEEGRRGNDGPSGLRGQRGSSGGDGPDGPVGPSGAPGARGDGGPQGAIGAPGPNGGMGARGPRGAKGKRGVSGVAGGSGQSGVQGLSGDRGSPGAMGLAGSAGEDGPSGPDGRDGRSGEIGDKGGQGDVGRIGIPGRPGAPGERGGVGSLGNDGAPGARGATGKRGGPGKTGQRGITGPRGPTGSPGLSGEPGDIGRSGATGSPGERGNFGERGRVGARGRPGTRGGRGPAGVQGSRGVKGPQGVPGEPGQQGSTGSPGQSGAPGATGAKGARGEMGGQGAVGPGGNPGRVGMPGSTGAPGARGVPGPPGLSGKSGPAGRRGETGSQGERGFRGIEGPLGVPGSRGEDGRSGSHGPAGPPGTPGPSGIIGELGGMGAMGAPGPTGPAGRPGADGATGKRGRAGEEGAPGGAGPPGPRGTRGPTGSDGRDGSRGNTGSQGLTGATGDRGAQGAQGPSGPAGMPGMRGPAGSQGERGSRGPAGPGGPRGSTGADGNVGPAGPAGPAGARGETGATGIQGHKGWGGSPGAPGAQGPKGQPGARGENGRPGPAGPAGTGGARGATGKDGTQGPRGMSGPRGSSGSDGRSGPAGPPGPPGPAGAPGAISYSQGYAFSGGFDSTDKGANPYTSSYGDEAEVDEDDFETRIKQLRLRIMKLMVPNGEAEYPARSCKDLFKSYPHLPSGYYTLDPSEGSDYDKFVAYCDRKTNGTCIYPDTPKVPKATYYLGDTEEPIDFSTMRNGSMISYSGPNSVQLTLLRLIYSKASQNLTYHCRNSLAVHNSKGRADRALTLVGSNNVRMGLKGTKADARYAVVGDDGCQERDDTWRQTTVVYTTKKTERLPLVDFTVSDVGRSGQQFGVDVGPVCFS